ncbi:MarR family winged helix-turn-helix transcriptional regulator [Nocardia zapadnayensis]|uniref:MarR family transcriptional regulator n=1 Tax=Brevibacterium pityocampae TaxID=506594 RepID=A0ABP8J6I2_9MICO|nr:MarR family winged helix-turn-helix transcriptional regulator [Nocardia zapadnayensis]MCX0277207.1 MarR family winged helix-turn-helix transcriptional regulator [Nocardia zapadnayensis]
MSSEKRTRQDASGEPRWLDTTEQHAWRNLVEAFELLMRRLDQDLRANFPIGMHEYELLVRLSEQPEHTMRMAVLADEVGMSRSRLTHIVTRMEKRGLVSRCSIPEDGRGVNCTMTEDGHALLVEAAPIHAAGVREHLIDLLDEHEIETMRDTFRTVNAHMRTQR